MKTIRTSELTHIHIEGIDLADYPEFPDAYIHSARWRTTGNELTDDELSTINPSDANNLIAESAISE